MKVLVIILALLRIALGADMKPMNRTELQALHRKNAITTVTEQVYAGAVSSAARGNRGYEWYNPGIVFDRDDGYVIRQLIQDLFPDSEVLYLTKGKNGFSVDWSGLAVAATAYASPSVSPSARPCSHTSATYPPPYASPTAYVTPYASPTAYASASPSKMMCSSFASPAPTSYWKNRKGDGL